MSDRKSSGNDHQNSNNDKESNNSCHHHGIVYTTDCSRDICGCDSIVIPIANYYITFIATYYFIPPQYSVITATVSTELATSVLQYNLLLTLISVISLFTVTCTILLYINYDNTLTILSVGSSE